MILGHPIRDEHIERALVIAEALSWENTPYLHRARVKGAGADCAQFPIAVYASCGIIPEVWPDYSRQWHLHKDREVYLEWVRSFDRVEEIDPEDVKPGDFMIWQQGRTYSHGAIVLNDVEIIHAVIRSGVVRDNYKTNELLKIKPCLAFTVWGN